MGIINTQTGEYEAPSKPVAPPEGVNPKTLPQKQGDPFGHVDVAAFDRAPEMDVAQLLTMADIAVSRGDQRASLRWKSMATERTIHDASVDARSDIMESFRPKAGMPEPGSKIVAPQVDTPWQQDSEFIRLQNLVAIANEKAELAKTPAAQLEANAALATAQADLRDRETAVKQAAFDSGAWTEADQRRIDAVGSLEAKAQQVAAQIWPTTQVPE